MPTVSENKLAPSHTLVPSGDTTGAIDTAGINAALAAVLTPYASLLSVGPTAAGGFVTLQPGIYYINAPLRIGSFTTLDARGSVINMVAGSNTNMLNNYGATAVVTSVNGGSTGAGGSTMTMSGGLSNPVIVDLLTVNSNTSGTVSPSWGATLIIPMPYTGNGYTNPAWNGVSGAQYCGNFFNINTFNQIQLENQGPPTPASVTSQTVSLFYRDTNITVLGGVWNHGTNGVGSDTGSGTDYLSHCFRFFACDGLTVDGCTILSQGSNGLYAICAYSTNASKFRNINFDTYPGDWSWNNGHTPGTSRDGVHLIGPCRDVHISDLYGSPGDDMVSLTCFDWFSSSAGVGGSFSNINIENIFCGYGGASVLRINGCAGVTCSHIRAKNLSGNATVALNIGDDLNNTSTSGSTLDDIVIDGVQITGNNAAGRYISLTGPVLNRIKFRNIDATQAAGSSVNLIEVGLGTTGSAQTTVISDLALENILPESVAAGKLVLNINSLTTINMLRLKDWDNPVANYQSIATAGTITAAMCSDELNLVSLTGQTATIASTTAFVPGLSGVYRFVVDLVTTTAGSAGTVTGSIITNNRSAAFTQTTATVSLASAGAEGSTTFTAYCGAGQNINYQTTVASAAGSPQYALRIRAKFLG
jgi:hypothetical protein